MSYSKKGLNSLYIHAYTFLSPSLMIPLPILRFL